MCCCSSTAGMCRRCAGDNVLFVGYSAWDSPKAFWDALKEDAAKDFIKYIEDHGVVMLNKKLWHVGEQGN